MTIMADTTTKPITTDDVAIETCSVELRVVRVGKKQMTLSVFRQIREEDCFDDEFRVVGRPWGIVNYCKCHSGHGEHHHVLWEQDGELRKCIVYKDGPKGRDWWNGNVIVEPTLAWHQFYARMAALPQLFIAV
jgi:hypothetical protein